MLYFLLTLYRSLKNTTVIRLGCMLLAVFVAGLSVLPAFAATPVTPRDQQALGDPQPRVLPTYQYTLQSVKMSYQASPSNFYRIGKDETKSFEFKITLDSPDIIEFDADTYFSGYDVESLDLIAVNGNNMPGACSGSPSYDECDSNFAHEVGGSQGGVWKKGETRTFTVAMTPDLMQKLTFSSSATGTLNKISLIPRFDYELTYIGKEPDESDFVPGLTIFFQVYDTKVQADGDAGKEPPPEAAGPNEGSSQGQPVCEDLPCYIGQMIAAIATLFNELIGWVVAHIVGPLIEALLSIRTFDAKFADVIYKAWLIFRNLGNIFFILAIVAIGVATVFRISGYAVKDLLVKLIIGAILINFSLVIAQVILGIADTVQNQFLPNNTGAIRLIAEALIKTDIFKTTQASDFGQFGTAVRTIVSMWLAFAAFIAFIGVAFLLLIRIVFLWLLLMTSPLPYIAMVLPVSRSMSKKWWSSFFKWAFITPAVAFMLNLTALIARESQDTFSNLVTVHNLDGTTQTILFAVGANFLPLVFLYMTLQVAMMFGKGTSGFVDKTIEKGAKGALWPGVAAGAAVAGLGASAAKGVKSAGSAVGGLALAPVKNTGQWAKDRVQLGYQNQVNKLRPKAGSEETRLGRFGSRLKSTVFNAASGGALTKENQAARQGKIQSAKLATSGVAKDYRLVAEGRKPQMVDRLEAEEIEKDLKKRSAEVSNQTAEETMDNIKNLLRKKSLGYGDKLDLQAYMMKSMNDDKTFGSILENNALPTSAMYGEAHNFDGDVQKLWKHIADRTTDDATKIKKKNAAGNYVEMDTNKTASRMAKAVNAVATTKGKLNLVTDSDIPDDPALRDKKVANILKGLTIDEMVSVNHDVFIPGGAISTNTDVKSRFASLVAAFKDDNTAQNLGRKFKPEQKDQYKLIPRADLQAMLLAHGLPTAEADHAADNFLNKMT